MSSTVCHAPMPPRIEAFTTRLCLRAVDQYERLFQTHFNKPNKSQRGQQRVKQQNDPSPTRQDRKDPSRDAAGSYTAISAFRQWRKTERTIIMGNRSSKASKRLAHSHAQKMEDFPLVLSDTTMPEEDLSLKFLALHALDLTAPASDVLLKNRLKSWFQLSGHPDVFAPAGPGTVWKRRTGGAENTERTVYEALSKDKQLSCYVPQFYREVEYKGDTFIELQDLLFGFDEPHVMDIKLGTRTFLESEVSTTVLRADLYDKMIAINPNAPTTTEHKTKTVTKMRYMQFREEQSSTWSHGFRIEAMKLPGGPPITDLKTVRSHESVTDTMRLFLGDNQSVCKMLLEKLRDLVATIEVSPYFQTHEVIGSSIFMIYDKEKVGVWLIDFAKTYPVPDGKRLNHRTPWVEGNHEEGLLFGLDNLISMLEEIQATL